MSEIRRIAIGLAAAIAVPGTACGDSPGDHLREVLRPAVTSTVDATVRQFTAERRYSSDDFPMDATAFEVFRSDVVRTLEHGLGLTAWTFRVPRGAAIPAQDRFVDRVLRTIDHDGVRMEVHAIDIVGTGLSVPVVLCLPSGRGPSPGILVLSGHSPHGLDDLVLDLDSYQRGIATRLAQAGFVAAAVEKIDSGYLARTFGAGSDEDLVAALQLGRGTTTRALQLKAALAAATVLAGHARVDGSRIGATGVSLGGWLATQTALLDDRIVAVADFGRKTLAVDASRESSEVDPCHTLPGLLALGDRNLFLLAYGPRALFAGHGRKDPQSAREGPLHFERPLRAQYERLGHAAHLEYLVHEGGDSMPDRAVVDYFRRVLGRGRP